MKRSRTIRAVAALQIAVVATCTVGCDSQAGKLAESPAAATPGVSGTAPTAATTAKALATSTTPAATSSVDYTRLLLDAGDISTPNNTFTGQTPMANPQGGAGAEVLLVNQNQTRAIDIMVLGFSGSGQAATALDEAKQSLVKSVTAPNLRPSPVGKGGTVTSGTSPDGKKSVAVLLFTQGAALARLEFDGLPNQPASDSLITDIGQKQAIALRVGQPG